MVETDTVAAAEAAVAPTGDQETGAVTSAGPITSPAGTAATSAELLEVEAAPEVGAMIEAMVVAVAATVGAVATETR